MTVSGNPASFVVRGAAAKVNSLTVPFSPIQSLNGYSHPWPAGGGVNLIDPTSLVAGFLGGTGQITSQDATRLEYSSADYIEIKQGVTKIAIGYNDFGTDISNRWSAICLYDETYTHLVRVNPSYASASDGIGLITTLSNYPTAKYFKYSTRTYGHGLDGCFCAYGDDTAYAPYSNICPISGRTGLNVYVSPTTAQADATTYAVDWTSEAGTVYGGTDNPVTGDLVSRYGMVDLGTLTASGWIYDSNRKGFTHTFAAPANANIMCSAYPIGTYADWANASKTNLIFYVKASNAIYLKTPDYTDGASLSAALSGVQMVYELATPITYQLTPQEVELLTGPNNVWSDTDSVITIDFDVLSFIRQKFIVNGTDFSRFIERDSYQTSLSPVYGETVQTIDGVGHTARLRLKGALRLALNPQTDTDTAAICTELLNSPCEVIYHCLQRDADVAARMTIDTVSASFLSRCLYWGDEWNQIEPITLTEL